MLTFHPAAKGIFPTYSIFAESLDALIEALQPPGARFVLLVAADTESYPSAMLQAWAGRALDRGATYACCWGAGAARLHHAFDLAAIDRVTDEVRDDEFSVIMTTDHVEESLPEAAWFATHVAYPAGIFEAGTDSIILAVVGNQAWHKELVQYLNDGAPIPDAV